MCATRAIATQNTCTVRTMTIIVHGVVVMVVNVEAMVRKCVATIPKVVSHVHMTVIDTRIDERHHDTFTLIPQVPNLVGTNLKDIRRDFAHGSRLTSHITFRNTIVLHGKADDGNVVTKGYRLNSRLSGIEVQGIGHPQDNR